MGVCTKTNSEASYLYKVGYYHITLIVSVSRFNKLSEFWHRQNNSVQSQTLDSLTLRQEQRQEDTYQLLLNPNDIVQLTIKNN